MSSLLIDVGNTRLKWAWLSPEGLGRQQALVHQGPRSIGQLLTKVLPASSRRRASLQRVLVVSVAGAALERALARACREQLGMRPQFERSGRSVAGVRNGYREVWRLGADRWVALIGARAWLPRRALCVVDVGTALTLDLLDENGCHRGGAIVPGPALMVETLLRGTRGIRSRAIDPAAMRTGLFARDTRGALEAGARYAVAAVIDRTRREARGVLGKAPRLLLTGGAAAVVAPLLDSPCRVVPDLVLRGLAVLAGPQSS